MSHNYLRVRNSDLKDKSPLAWHVLIKLLWLSMVSIFLPAILRFEYGLSLAQIFLFEAAYSAVVLVFMYFGSLKFTARHGTIPSMILWVCVFSVNFIILYFAKQIPRLLFLSPVFSGIYVAYFWVGYHTAMAIKSPNERHFWVAHSWLESVWIIAWLIWPLLGGLLVDFVWSNALYIVTFFCLLISCVPLLFHQRHHSPTTFHPSGSFRRTYKDASFIRAVFASFSSMGYVYFVWTVVWTIVIYNYFGSYTKLALVSIWSSVLLLLALRYIGKQHDSAGGKENAVLTRFLTRSFWSQSGTWLFATVLLLAWLLSQVLFLFIDTIHKITYRVNELSLMNYFYEAIGENESIKGILDNIFVREVAIHGSKLVFCCLLAWVTLLFPSYEDWWLIFSLFSVILIAPFGIHLLKRKHDTLSSSLHKKNAMK